MAGGPSFRVFDTKAIVHSRIPGIMKQDTLQDTEVNPLDLTTKASKRRQDSLQEDKRTVSVDEEKNSVAMPGVDSQKQSDSQNPLSPAFRLVAHQPINFQVYPTTIETTEQESSKNVDSDVEKKLVCGQNSKSSRKKARSQSTNDKSTEVKHKKRRYTRRKPRAYPLLWEFLSSLLLDSRYNPSHVQWDDLQQGMFKIVNTRNVAEMWGQYKNEGKHVATKMSYEHMSRAMRHYYREEILSPVPQRRLVYQLGPKIRQQTIEQAYSRGFK